MGSFEGAHTHGIGAKSGPCQLGSPHRRRTLHRNGRATRSGCHRPLNLSNMRFSEASVLLSETAVYHNPQVLI
jgi:hypothetical protein